MLGIVVELLRQPKEGGEGRVLRKERDLVARFVFWRCRGRDSQTGKINSANDNAFSSIRNPMQ